LTCGGTSGYGLYNLGLGSVNALPETLFRYLPLLTGTVPNGETAA